MKKTNKKGFTLIEMLVVIAIIAILVAIIIPTVTSATTKAKASTDAANLRSAKAVITIGLLDDSIDTDADVSQGENEHAFLGDLDLGIPFKAKSDDALEFDVDIDTASGSSGATVTVMYGTKTIADFAKDAGESGEGD